MVDNRVAPVQGLSGFVRAGMWCALILGSAACRKADLTGQSGLLVFSSPDQPTLVTEPDAGLVLVAFGPVPLAATKSLTLSAVSLGVPVTLAALSPIQADPEFSFPLALGTVGTSSPSQTTVSFTPSSLGEKSATFQLAAAGPTTGNVTIELTGTGVPSGLTVSPNPVDFGAVEINRSQAIPVTIANIGRQPVSLILSSLQGANPALFRLGAPTSNVIAPGSSAAVSMVFAPLSVGPADASVTVSASADSPAFQVSLTGTGVQSWLQAASPVDFGFVQITDTFVKSALVTNASQYVTLHLTAPAPLIAQPNGSSAFGVEPLTAALPLTIGPQQSAPIPLSFAPRSLGAFTGTLFVATDDPDENLVAIELQGYGGGPHLTCQSMLAFGPTPLGLPLMAPAVCINTGADIPAHPEIRLQIAQSGISSDNPAFAAVLQLPDGGPASSGDGISLGSGQSVSIGVTFHPDDAGAFHGRLGVASNDLDDLDAGTLLSGAGFVPGPCQIQAAPGQLSFGEVTPGNIGTLQFAVSNLGQDYCALSLALDPSSDPAFSLSAGQPDHAVLSFVSNTDNPTVLPTTLVVDVQYAPLAPEAAGTGTVEIHTMSVATPVDIPLTGISQPACLDILPPSHDFGLVGISPSNSLCGPDSVTFTAENQCSQPVTIYRYWVNSGVGSEADFAFENTPSLPLTIPAGGQAAFEVGFVPPDPGPKVGAVIVDTSEFDRVPFLLTLRGDAETVGIHTDTFVAPPPSTKVDFLWVIDEDDDYDQVASLAQLTPQLIDAMDQAHIDYRIAVTSTDTCDAGASDKGAFEPCDHCLSNASADPTFVTPATSDPAGTLADLFGFFDIAPQLDYCAGFEGDEHFFDAIAAALSPDALQGHNAGFLRPDAYLAIVVVNGDSEDDANAAQWGHTYFTSLAQVTDLVQGLKLGPSLVSVSYINSGAGTLEAAQQMGQLVLATGGQEIDTSLPADVWQSALVDLFTSTPKPVVFRLSTQPASPSDMQVQVNGAPNTAWSYEPTSNTVLFTPGQDPPPGATVTVTYQVGCSS